MLKNKVEVNMTKSISVRIHFSDDEIRNVINSSAQGSSYWCEDSGELGYESAVNAIMNGKMIALHDAEEDGKYYELTLKKIKKGLTILAKKYFHHIGDIKSGSGDMYTGDAVIQCALFGDIIYG